MGIEILDSFYAVYGSPPSVEGEVDQALAFASGESSQPPVGVFGALTRGTSPSRATGGEVSNVITPGGGFFVALWGKWDNVNGDAMVDMRYETYADTQSYEIEIGNEWSVDNSGDPLLGYVVPGSHPTLISASRPADDMPDFIYKQQSHVFVSSGEAAQSEIPITSHILFTDGSLFRHVRVITMSRPLLAPDPDGRFPHTPRPTSLVDIDDYGALAPGSVSDVYGRLLGDTIEAVGSPNLGLCPNRCVVDPTLLAGTPLASVAGDVWGRYPQEWQPGSGSSRAGRWDEHKAAYRPWIDLIPMTRTNPLGSQGLSHLESRDIPLQGHRADGAQTSAPGFVTFETWTGLWHDINGDGHVGSAATHDAYEGGARPNPDDYYASHGEYISLRPENTPGFKVTLTPHGAWGDGVIVVDPRNEISPEIPSTGRGLLASLERGTYEPIVLEMETARSEDAVFPGHYITAFSVLMPSGSPGFDVCTEPLPLTYEVGSDSGIETLVDCDTIAPWEGP